MSILYFGYGSNLDWDDWYDYCERTGHNPFGLVDLGIAFLPDHRMVWHYHSKTREGGAADVIAGDIGEVVPGVLFRLEGDAAEAMEKKEGSPNYYCKKNVVVLTADGKQVEAITYVVNEKKIMDSFIHPKTEYTDLIRKGLSIRGLPTKMLDDSLNCVYPSFPVKSVFVYGTLRKWGSRHDIITRYDPYESVEKCKTNALMMDYDQFPGLVPGDKVIYGEIYSYYNPSRPLEHLDFIEGHQNWCSPKCLFQRRIVTIDAQDKQRFAWTYMICNWDAPLVESGDWMEHTRYRKHNR
jgi:gamma-glutamylcyclotransferase (GGCT)/AIG2-like uncharacterized protein YtfP